MKKITFAPLFIYIFLVGFFYLTPSWGSVRVAFLEIVKPDGTLLRYSEGGRFTHSAISYQDGWLQAYPYYGVQKVTEQQLKQIGRIAMILDLPHIPDLREEDVRPFLGRPFDLHYSWTDEEIYCAELLAKLLGVPPEPMRFDPRYWPASYQKLDGLPGMSPDRLFEILSAKTRKKK